MIHSHTFSMLGKEFIIQWTDDPDADLFPCAGTLRELPSNIVIDPVDRPHKYMEVWNRKTIKSKEAK